MDPLIKWPFPENINLLWKLNSKICLTGVSFLSRLWMSLNKVSVYNMNELVDKVDNRPSNRSMVTVSNHYSCLDEPCLWGLLKFRHMTYQSHLHRWALAADDICFTRKLHSWFFSHGQCIPVVRGDGVYQRGMDFALQKLNEGAWVHTFPEGKVNMEKEYLRLKWGVGRLISECDHVPVVVPFYHIGMDEVLHNEPPYIPRIGKKVTVLVGNPIEFEEQLKLLKNDNKSPVEIRKAVTDHIQEELRVLRLQAEDLHNNNKEPSWGISHYTSKKYR